MEGQKEINAQFTSEQPEYQMFIDDHNNCALCGTQLVFKHKIDFLTLRIQEDASCPSCHIPLKTREHGLQ